MDNLDNLRRHTLTRTPETLRKNILRATWKGVSTAGSLLDDLFCMLMWNFSSGAGILILLLLQFSDVGSNRPDLQSWTLAGICLLLAFNITSIRALRALWRQCLVRTRLRHATTCQAMLDQIDDLPFLNSMRLASEAQRRAIDDDIENFDLKDIGAIWTSWKDSGALLLAGDLEMISEAIIWRTSARAKPHGLVDIAMNRRSVLSILPPDNFLVPTPSQDGSASDPAATSVTRVGVGP